MSFIPKTNILIAKYLAFDMEMTGLSPERDEILEIAAVPITGAKIDTEGAFFAEINPEHTIKPSAKAIHGIGGDKRYFSMEPKLDEVLPQFLQMTSDRIIVAMNPRLDLEFLRVAGKNHAVEIPRFSIVDIARLYVYFYPATDRWNLDQIAKSFGLWGRTGNHNALDDAILTARIFCKMLAKLRGNVRDTGELLSISRMM